jgi:hypothetical protein
MRLWTAGSNNQAVQLMLDYLFLDLVLGILTACKKVLIRVNNIRKF